MSISLPISSGTIGNIAQLTVDARALHCALEVKRDFSNWIKARITKYGFAEGEDYEKSSMIPSSPKMANGLKVAIEYRLSVNMGKELAMVENNERGRMVRRYFIECERRLMETPTPALPTLSIEDRRPLSNLIGQWAGKAQMSFPDCWRELHTVFGISTVAELPAFQLPAALAWVQAKIDGIGCAALPAPADDAPDFPLELAVYGYKGGKDPVNMWEEMQEAERLLTGCCNAVWMCCNSGRSMYLSSEKNLFYEMLKKSLSHAEASLTMAKQAVSMCLSLKSRVDFHSI